MPAQFTDVVRWQDRTFSLVGVEGDELFDAGDRGLRVEPTSTANRRGCVVEFTIVDDGRLVVDTLRQVGLCEEQRRQPPAIAGVTPVADEVEGVKYVSINLDVPFTGRLLVAAKPLTGMPFTHMGFLPAWRFGEVWILAFKDGQLVETTDISSDVEHLRNSILAGETPDPSGDPNEEDWVDRQFQLDFDRSLGPKR